ncbi:L,D-transpeptidase [Endozoicomonas sp. SM1973]|uniref:L,D-transpeptidase n=1 Tax=Spartinivicinus marinus TaxID=2994442 RepID=A0A853IC61_9GAMM|nr:L,D-transpeptidase [Spartinivicinus marinus]MCX4029309.1 L,D-transpeptidase [Spartinivicinus marinus]NYZ68148.1 L,D-transpeptidase [Spartinivicinus marinus]
MRKPVIYVSIAEQTLRVCDGDRLITRYSVSTAAKGAGQCQGSYQTPLGRHIIRAKVGGNCPLNAVFVGRRFTGEIYNETLARQFPNRDWILTRILWLSGQEPGVNRLGEVDSMRRYIYIHGTPDSEPMGIPASHGCIRMRNDEVVELFSSVPVYTQVIIENE